MFDIRIRLGDVLRIGAADRYRPADGPVTLWVTGVRLVVNRPEHEEWVWVEGRKLTRDGRRGDYAQYLVRASWLPGQQQATRPRSEQSTP